MYVAHMRDDAAAACTHNLSVNGGGPVDVRYPALGWEQWSVVRFTKGTCFADIDAMDVGNKPLP